MLRGYGGLNADDLYVGSGRGGYLGDYVQTGLGLSADVHVPLGLSALLQSGFLDYRLHFSQFLDQNPTLFQPIGGMDAIVDAFEERVGHLIQYRSPVEEIRQTSGGAQIIYSRDGRPSQALDADFAICTIPPPVLKDIPNNFSSDTQAAIESVQFVPAVKIAFQTRRRFWEEDQAIYGGISWTDQDITQIWYPAAGYHRNKGVLLGAYIWSYGPGLRYTDLRPDERAQAAIEEGERLHPGYADEIEAWGQPRLGQGALPEGRLGPGAVIACRKDCAAPKAQSILRASTVKRLDWVARGCCLGDLRGSRGDQRTSDGRRSLMRQRAK